MGLKTTPKGNRTPVAGMKSRDAENVCDAVATTSESRSANRGAEWGAFVRSHPDLAAVVDSWPTLPEAVKAGIVAMVEATQTNERAQWHSRE